MHLALKRALRNEARVNIFNFERGPSLEFLERIFSHYGRVVPFIFQIVLFSKGWKTFGVNNSHFSKFS